VAMIRVLCAVCACAVVFCGDADAYGEDIKGAWVRLRLLDKVAARVHMFDLSMQEEASFGALRIRPRVCYKKPPEEVPDVGVWLEILDVKESPPLIFRGWMFASSRSLSGIDHAVYDVWVVDCFEKKP